MQYDNCSSAMASGKSPFGPVTRPDRKAVERLYRIYRAFGGGFTPLPEGVRNQLRGYYEANGVVFLPNDGGVGVRLRDLAPRLKDKEPGMQDADRLARRQRLSRAEAAVQDASLSVHRQRERVEALEQIGDAAKARLAKAELEMLQDSLRRRMTDRDAISRDFASGLAAIESEGKALYRVGQSGADGRWRVVGPNGLAGDFPTEREALARADDLNVQIAEEREDDA